jgi:gas vesicle protein
MAKDDGGGGFFAGLLLGGLLGAAMALLFTPQSGEETVSMIRDKGIELKDRMADMSPEDARKAIQEAIAEGKGVASRAKEEMRSKIEQMKPQPVQPEPPTAEIPLA